LHELFGALSAAGAGDEENAFIWDSPL
jgi:hypothetical protein